MFGEHAAFIVPAYLITAVSIAAMVIVTLATHRKRRSELQAIEASQTSGERS